MAANSSDTLPQTSNLTAQNGITSVMDNDHGEFIKYVFPIIMTFGLVGNLISFLTMIRKEWRRKSTSVYIALLAIVDTVSMIALFNDDYLFARGQKTIPGPLSLCNSQAFFIGGSLCSSAWLLVAVTMERVIAVFIPMKIKFILTTKRAMMVAFAILLACYGSYGYMVYSMEASPLSMGCSLRPERRNWYTTGGIFVLHGIFKGYVPAVLITFCNVAIGIQLKRRTMVTSSREASAAGNPIRKSTIMVVVISTAFVLLVTPSSLIVTLRGFLGIQLGSAKTYNIIRTVTDMMGFMNHAINFYLYVGCSQQFRTSLQKMIPVRIKTATADTGTKSTDSGTRKSDTGYIESRQIRDCPVDEINDVID